MAKLKTTYVSGNLFVTGSQTFVSASQFIGNLTGTASVAENIDPDADLRVKSLNVSGSAVVGGDLKVMGDLTYVGVKDLRVKDKTIELNADDSGSAVASADGAGIIIKNSDPEGDISITYDKNSDSLVLNKPLSGSIAEATKVKFSLKIGSGFEESGSSFDGHEEVNITLDDEYVKNLKVKEAIKADHADSASKVDNKLTVASDVAGRLTIDSDFDGSTPATISLNLTDITDKIAENKASASAELAAASQSISSSIATLASASSAALTDLSSSVATDFSASDAARVALSSSIATDFSASDAARVALSESVASSSAAFSASVAADFETIKSGSEEALEQFSASVATDFSASNAHVEEVSSSLSSSISALSSSADNTYVKKAGDTMTGALNMGNNAIQLGDMKLVWNATEQAITFVVEE